MIMMMMKKLEEREPEGPVPPLAKAPALAVQFFLIPLAVVGAVVLVYGGFRMLVTTERTPEEYLSDVQSGGRERRWPAAFELARVLSDPDIEARYPGLGTAIVQTFADAEGDDPRVRQYLALAIGRLASPPAGAIDELVAALDDPDPETQISVIWALASLDDGASIEHIAAMYRSDDAGVRKMAVYALGALPGEAALTTLQNGLDDPTADVQWNAAVALARHGQTDGVPILRRMLDRTYVERVVTRTPTTDATVDLVSEVIVSGLDAVATLGVSGLRDEIRALSEGDTSLRVREVAIRTLDALRSDDSTLNHADQAAWADQ